jgi:carbon storage regulator
MLVLSRHRDESIIASFTAIDPTTGQKVNVKLEFVVVDIRGDKVRLGIEAPNFIPVHRREVYEAIVREQRENRQSE